MDKLEQILKEYQKLIDKYNWKDKLSIRQKWLKKKKDSVIALNVVYIDNEEKYLAYHFKVQLSVWKTKYYLNDSTQRTVVLYCSNKIICITKRNNIDT